MKITYISHSGFALELEQHILLFDYFKGKVPRFSRDKIILVFASHVHQDHYVEDIFDLANQYPQLDYVLSSDIRKSSKKVISQKGLENQVHFMRANQEIEIGAVRIRTLRSTDAGVAFVVECENKSIYHAGDLNWWHWEGESEEYNAHMKDIYLREIEKLKCKQIDVAFVPVDPRLGEQFYYGMHAFAKRVDTKLLVPMHFWGDYTVCKKLMNLKQTEAYRMKIYPITKEGEEIQKVL